MSEFEDFRKFAVEEEAEWKAATEKKGVAVARRVLADSPLKVSRGTTVVAAPVAFVRKMVERAELRPKWDNLIAECKVLRTENADHMVAYMRSVSPGMFISARDFVLDVRAKAYDDGSQVILASSPATEEESAKEAPVPKGVVRGRATNSGYVLTPVDGDAARTRVVYVIQLDLAGSLPTALVNSALADEPLCLAEFRDLIEKTFAEEQGSK